METFNEVLGYLRRKRGLKQAEIAEKVGISAATWSDYERGKTEPNLTVLAKISEVLQVDLDTLLGRSKVSVHVIGNPFEKKNIGESTPKSTPNSTPNRVNEPNPAYQNRMPKVVTVDSQGNDNVVMVPLRARAGYLAGYEDPEFIQTLPSYRLPGLTHGTFRMFEIYGQSMVPTYHESDIVIARFVENFNEIRDDRVHIIITKREGVVAKRVINRVQREGKLILNSDNQRHPGEYPPIVIDPEDILEIWYAVAFISRQMRKPGEVYSRLIEVESRVTLLEDQLTNNRKLK
jgi:transcriptional regulator with XRE-family HTH domain